jgi:hypothetical protein
VTKPGREQEQERGQAPVPAWERAAMKRAAMQQARTDQKANAVWRAVRWTAYRKSRRRMRRQRESGLQQGLRVSWERWSASFFFWPPSAFWMAGIIERNTIGPPDVFSGNAMSIISGLKVVTISEFCKLMPI